MTSLANVGILSLAVARQAASRLNPLWVRDKPPDVSVGSLDIIYFLNNV